MPPVVLLLIQMFACALAKALPCLIGLCATLTKYTTSVCFDLCMYLPGLLCIRMYLYAGT